MTQTFFEHLEALRTVLLRCLVTVGIFYVPSYFLAQFCIQWLISWCCPAEIGQLNFFSPMEVFIVQLKLALVLAVLISFPYCIWQIWNFLLPALQAHEKEALKYWIVLASFLFVCGVAFCVLLILPLVMQFAVSFASDKLNPVIGLADFLNLSCGLMLVFGVGFQLPLTVLLCVRFGLIQVQFLRDKRTYVVVGILIVSAVVTPPDIISQIMLALPMWLLFELGLLLARRIEIKL
ncbi:MAG: twin-arginine translocase subunit TatC [Deltaproteobacteria bacterium]|jgi:sec-independent protein translocase protein TatC|nr:twin-arginine translocase subunit TatC [Deltaproteobacteria bacterium]